MADVYHRRSIRLKGYDYAQAGAYFVTICTHGRAHLFGTVVDGEMVLSLVGTIVEAEWLQTAVVRPSVELDAYVIMPNHVHGIVVITDDSVDGAVGAQCIAPLPSAASLPPKKGVTPNNVAPNSLGAIVRGFKSAVSRQVHRLPNPPDHPVWQRNYHEHIIRHQADLDRIRGYIETNPARWRDDSLFSP